jgi:hypothetical protein
MSPDAMTLTEQKACEITFQQRRKLTSHAHFARLKRA